MSDLEFMLIAVVGIVLQEGVMVFAAVGVYLPTWNDRFDKDRKPVRKQPLSPTPKTLAGIF